MFFSSVLAARSPSLGRGLSLYCTSLSLFSRRVLLGVVSLSFVPLAREMLVLHPRLGPVAPFLRSLGNRFPIPSPLVVGDAERPEVLRYVYHARYAGASAGVGHTGGR